MRSSYYIAVVAITVASTTAAIVALAAWRSRIERFQARSTGAVEAILGSRLHATAVQKGPSSLAVRTGGSDAIEFVTHATPFVLKPTLVMPGMVRLVAYSPLIARGAFVADTFVMGPPQSRAIRAGVVSKVVDSRSADVHDVHITPPDAAMDLTWLAKGHHAPVQFHVVHTMFEAKRHVVGPRPGFVTPEILKYHPLAGVTIVVPRPGASGCVVVMRRYRREGGYVVLRVTAGDHGVNVRQITFKSAKPRTVSLATAAIDWNGGGGYDGNLVGTQPTEGDSFYDVETMSEAEVRGATLSAEEVSFPSLVSTGVTVVTVTPGAVRATCVGTADETMRARMVGSPGFMSTGSYEWSPIHPIQMSVRGGVATAFPLADHTSAPSLLGTTLV